MNQLSFPRRSSSDLLITLSSAWIEATQTSGLALQAAKAALCDVSAAGLIPGSPKHRQVHSRWRKSPFSKAPWVTDSPDSRVSLRLLMWRSGLVQCITPHSCLSRAQLGRGHTTPTDRHRKLKKQTNEILWKWLL